MKTISRPAFFCTILFLVIAPLACDSSSDVFYNLKGVLFFSINIQVDGQPRFEGIEAIPVGTPVEEIWDMLGKVEFESTGIEDREEKDASESRTLTGSIVVSFGHGDIHAEKTLETITLRSEDRGQSWSLSESEVRRIKAVVQDE